MRPDPPAEAIPTPRHGRRRRRLRRTWTALAALVVLAAGSAVVAYHWPSSERNGAQHAGTPSGTTSTPTVYPTVEGPTVPRSGADVGAWVYPRPFTQDGRVSSVKRFETQIGRPLDFVHLYRRLGMQIGTPSDLAFARSGKDLLISWPAADTRQIVSGRYDAAVAKTAREIRALPTKVFFEFRWEMDRPNLRGVVHGASAYIAAWDHVRAIFTKQHVTNVAWTWCPTAGGFDNGTAQAYYPGDDEVDWVCADVYPLHPWRVGDYEAFSTLTQSFMTWAAKHVKPVIIGELAVGTSFGARRAQWIADAGAYVEAHRQIKAIAWFEQSLTKDPDYYHWALQGDQPALEAFAVLTRQPYFRGGD